VVIYENGLGVVIRMKKWVRMVRCGNGKEVKGLKLGTLDWWEYFELGGIINWRILKLEIKSV
jgi:hypothetical protein